MSKPSKSRVGRKLLIASLGVATLKLTACGMTATSGNLVAPPPEDASTATPDGGSRDGGSRDGN